MRHVYGMSIAFHANPQHIRRLVASIQNNTVTSRRRLLRTLFRVYLAMLSPGGVVQSIKHVY